jgi:phosphomethylpyrimidine synthase
MRISQEVRDYAAAKHLSEQEALAAGMEEKSREFARGGGRLYVPAGEEAG